MSDPRMRRAKCAMCGQTPDATSGRDAANARAEAAQRDMRTIGATSALWEKRALAAEAQRDDLLAACELVDAALREAKHPDDNTWWTLSLTRKDADDIRAAIARARGTK